MGDSREIEDPVASDNAEKGDVQPAKQDPPSYDEQSTSMGIPSTSHSIAVKSLITLHRSATLSSLDELADRLLAGKGLMEDNDSFVTVDGCRKDMMTTTEPTVFFSMNERTQNFFATRSNPSNYPPPPPYEDIVSSSRQGRVGQTPVYQERYTGNAPPVTDVGRAPAYRRNYEGDDAYLDFDSKAIRNRFVQKVYMILAFQLLLTFGFIALCIFEKNVKKFVLTQFPIFVLAIVVYSTTVIVLFCYESTRRIFPLNFILLLLVTCSMAYITAVMSCMYSTYIVLVTFGVSAGICLLFSLIACQTWFDVTECGMVLCMASLVVMIYGLIATFVTLFTGSNVTFLIYACLATLLFCGYLMYDTQQILGGRRVELSPEEYVLGALTLYIDFMMIFQYLLYIFGELGGQ